MQGLRLTIGLCWLRGRSGLNLRGLRLMMGLCALALVSVGCREEQTAPRIAQEPQAQESRDVAPSDLSEPAGEDSAEGLMAPTAKPIAGADLEDAKQRFEDVDLPDSARVAAARRLLLSGDGAEVTYLVDGYSLRNNSLVERALIEELTAAGDEAVLPLLLGLFAGVGGEERIDFEQYILRFGRGAEIQMMALLHADDASLVLRALDALGKMKSTTATDSIADLLDHPNSWVRMESAHAMGQIGDPGAVEHLLVALGDTTYAVVNAALVGLGRLRATEAYEQVAALISSQNTHIRKHAAMALAELGDRRAIPAVRALAEGDADPGVRFMAKRALQKLEPGE